MSNVRQVEIKKSELAMYKGLGQTNAQLAKRYGVSTSEIADALVTFGMVKGKSLKKDYQVTYTNDVDMEEEATGVDADMDTSNYEMDEVEEVEEVEEY
jgi:hypothetical protein